MDKVVTHNRQFNLDEIAAISLLKKFTNKDYEIIRTRDVKKLKEYKENPNVFVLDVGLEYDKSKKNFDHHQKTMSKVWDGGIPYSSCGLIWDWLKTEGYLSEFSNNELMKFETNFIRKVDAQDNGLKIFNEMNFVRKSNRNHKDDSVLDKHFMKTLKIMDVQIDVLTKNIKNGMKSPLINKSKVTPYLDYLMTASLMKNYYFCENMNMKTENGKLLFSYEDKHGVAQSFHYNLNKKTFVDLESNESKINTTLTEHAWKNIKNNPKVSQVMNPETIELMENRLISNFSLESQLPVEMAYLFMYESGGLSQEIGFKAVNGFVANTFSEIRSDLRNEKEIKKYVKKSENIEHIVVCEQNIKDAPEKIKEMAPETRLLIIPRSGDSWKIQALKPEANMPKEWRGLSDKKLKQIANDDRLIFCHKSGFMLMIQCSKDEAIEFAKKLEAPKQSMKNNQERSQEKSVTISKKRSRLGLRR